MSGFRFSGGGGGGGGGAVTSVFGRVGAVVRVNGDYTASNITNVPAGTIGSITVQAALNELDGDVVALASTVSGLVTGVSSVFGRSGAVVAVLNDYSAAQVSNSPAGNIAAATVQAAINELDSEKGGLGLANTWSLDNTFNGFVSATSFRVGANPVIDANRIFLPRSYTIGTLPAVTATGIIHCSDLGGGAGLLSSDGTGWVREDNTGSATIATDAGHTFTWTRLTNAPLTRGNAALTALRTATLSTTGCRNGDRAAFVRLGGGAFNWDIAGGTTFSLTSSNQYCVFEFDGTTWNITESGLLATGTGVVGALQINVGTPGSFVVNGGALGTPSSGTATNLTGLPISTGLTGAGTGVLAALAVNVGSAGAFVTFGGAGGTPSSLTLTNATGLVLTGGAGVTGLLPIANGGTATATPALVAGTNVTITGTWPNQTINASGGGGSGVNVQDEGGAILTPATTLNFVGAGVTATNGGGGVATVTIPGGGSGSGMSIGQYYGLRNASHF